MTLLEPVKSIALHLRHALIVALVFSFSAGASSPEKADEQLIMDSIHTMWAAIESGNLDAYLEHIHPDYSVFGEGDVYLHSGKDKEQRDIGDFIKRSKGVRTFMHQPQVTVRGNTAWITYYWNDAGYSSGKRFTSRGKSTRIFVKENDQWLCIHSHFTAIP